MPTTVFFGTNQTIAAFFDQNAEQDVCIGLFSIVSLAARENLFFAFVYNAIGVPLAAGVLFPTFGLLLNPMIAAAAVSFRSVSVIAIALRLRVTRL